MYHVTGYVTPSQHGRALRTSGQRYLFIQRILCTETTVVLLRGRLHAAAARGGGAGDGGANNPHPATFITPTLPP